MKIKLFSMAFIAFLMTAVSVNAQKTIVDLAVGSPNHTTLVAAVKAADLVATLQSAGPFTVFAPTNDAFAKLPAGTIPFLLKAENKATLAKILTYHVVAGNLNAEEAVALAKNNMIPLLIPCHYDLFEFNTVNVNGFIEAAIKGKQKYCVLDLGGKITGSEI